MRMQITLARLQKMALEDKSSATNIPRSQGPPPKTPKIAEGL